MSQKTNNKLLESLKGFPQIDERIKGNSEVSLAGLGGSAALLSLFSFLTTRAVKHKDLELDKSFEQWLDTIESKPLKRYFRSYSLLGKEPVTLSLAVAAFMFLIRRKQPLAAWLVLISTWGGWLLSRPVKGLVRRQRPFSLNTLQHHPNAYSFPSGHSVAAVCFYGILTWLGLKLLKRKLSRLGWALLMVNLILMIGFSRAYLKEHHPSDVLGGYLLGGFWLTVVICAAGMYAPQDKAE